jgi:hypothetical protein
MVGLAARIDGDAVGLAVLVALRESVAGNRCDVFLGDFVFK